ncbi:MAG TPA: DUF4390 domain-containing protein [Usitatibacter sp.]|jgi:hypothetical protein|nr:DUF4390 domain-containing protein [Usitatibacter sp.]
MSPALPSLLRSRAVFHGVWRWAARALVALGLLLSPALAQAADGINVTSANLEQGEDGWLLSSEFEISFSPKLEEAVNRGVPLYFVVDFEVARPRWYWFDEKPIQVSLTYKVSYTPLLRQYRLSVGNVSQNFTTFEEVTRVLSRLRGLQVAGRNAFTKGVTYQAGIRMRLDTAQLPKPFQLDAFASRDWALASDWYRWAVVTP